MQENDYTECYNSLHVTPV